MTEDELNLWKRYDQRDETVRKELILFYLPLAIFWAKRISRIAGWANWEDLRQEGVIGLMKAVEKFDLSQGVPFKTFARPYIRGAIFDSSELTRDMARQQEEIYRKIKQAEDELTKTLQRLPTSEEVAEKTGLTVEKMRTAIDAMGIAFAGEFPDSENLTASRGVQTASQERAAVIDDELSLLTKNEQKVIGYYYWEELSDKEIAERLGLTVSNVTKIRQRAIDKLRNRFDVKKRGGHDED
jgi:RNA polymerase sigma factor for flagellar operon FliA